MFNVHKLYFKTWKAFWIIDVGRPKHGYNVFIVKLKNRIKSPLFDLK